MHPFNDNMKVTVDLADEYGFGAEGKGVETGIIKEIPDIEMLISYGMHNFAFESSFMNEEKLKKLISKLKKLIGTRIWWESYQERGRRLKVTYPDGTIEEIVVLKMSDILIFSDDIKTVATMVEDERSGSFKV